MYPCRRRPLGLHRFHQNNNAQRLLLDSPLFTTPPREVCILRLSAIGDVCHALAVVRTLQQAWPRTRFTWVIGRLEARLFKGIDDIEFIVFDKGKGLAAYLELRRAMRGRRFDLLLHMQLALRAGVCPAH